MNGGLAVLGVLPMGDDDCVVGSLLTPGFFDLSLCSLLSSAPMVRPPGKGVIVVT